MDDCGVIESTPSLKIVGESISIGIIEAYHAMLHRHNLHYKCSTSSQFFPMTTKKNELQMQRSSAEVSAFISYVS